MPRRNRRRPPRRNRYPIPTEVPQPSYTTDQMAMRLVLRGDAPATILGFVPPWAEHKRSGRTDD